MVRWLIRLLLGTCALLVLAAALGNRAPGEPAGPSVEAVVAATPPVESATPRATPRPTATPEQFVERIISRVSREPQAPYPTSTPLPTGVALVSIVDFGYMPSVSRIHVGQTVIWQNGGRELHDVTGDDDWYSGPIEGPTEYRHTFGFEGTFTYRCSVHPDMHGTILVIP
jgi:plastocyanin